MIFARRRKLVVWGLRAPARLTVGEDVAVSLDDDRDAAFVDGFLTGLMSLPRVDLARRLWSGRVSEFLGDLSFDGWDAYRLDIAVRGLGFRRRVEREYRGLDPDAKARCEAWSTGVNAWIDQQELPQSKTYRRLGSLPRLMGGADALLLHRAPAELWATPPGEGDVRRLFDRLRASALHSAGGLGDADLARVPNVLPFDGAYLPPTEAGIDVLPDDDGHRWTTSEGPRRLYVDRPDIAVRDGGVRRPWIRRTPAGWLWSDACAAGPIPPSGPGRVVVWPRPSAESPPTPPTFPPLELDDPRRVHPVDRGFRGTLHLEPKRG